MRNFDTVSRWKRLGHSSVVPKTDTLFMYTSNVSDITLIPYPRANLKIRPPITLDFRARHGPYIKELNYIAQCAVGVFNLDQKLQKPDCFIHYYDVK